MKKLMHARNHSEVDPTEDDVNEWITKFLGAGSPKEKRSRRPAIVAASLLLLAAGSFLFRNLLKSL